jgi:hypothetical protein
VAGVSSVMPTLLMSASRSLCSAAAADAVVAPPCVRARPEGVVSTR